VTTRRDFYETYYAKRSEFDHVWYEEGGVYKAQNIVKIANELRIRTVLDVGTGQGAVLAPLAAAGFVERYWAIDVAEHAVSIVRQRQDLPKLVEARVFDGRYIPYADGQFDLAILSHVIEHIPDPRPLLREAARVARYVTVEVPLEKNLHTLLKVLLGKGGYREEVGHVQWFSQSRFRSLLERDCGLEIVRMEMVYVPDELYLLRKGNTQRTAFELRIRKAVRLLGNRVYTRLLTDHCIALVRALNRPPDSDTR
jgi:SAM-dependent methyltransferase